VSYRRSSLLALQLASSPSPSDLLVSGKTVAKVNESAAKWIQMSSDDAKTSTLPRRSRIQVGWSASFSGTWLCLPYCILLKKKDLKRARGLQITRQPGANREAVLYSAQQRNGICTDALTGSSFSWRLALPALTCKRRGSCRNQAVWTIKSRPIFLTRRQKRCKLH
jgi:hypothetical protein